MALLTDGREFLDDNRAGRIAPAQLAALQDSYSLKDLGLGPVARLLRKDAALGRDLDARVVAHFDGALKPDERDLRQTLTKFAVGAAIEIGSAFLLGTRVGNEGAGSSSSSSTDLTAVHLFGRDRQPRRLVGVGPQLKIIEELGLARVHHLPESGRILSVEPLEPSELGHSLNPQEVAVQLGRAREEQDWFAFRVLQGQLPAGAPGGSPGAAGHPGYAAPAGLATAPDVLGRWSDGASVDVTFGESGVATAVVNGVARHGTWSLADGGHLSTDVLDSAKPYRAYLADSDLILRAGFRMLRLHRVG